MDRFLIAACPDSKNRAGVWRVGPALDPRIEGQKALVALDGHRVIAPNDPIRPRRALMGMRGASAETQRLTDEKRLVVEPNTGQILAVKATVAELHRDTAKLVKPVIDGQQTLVITERGQARAKIVPLPRRPDRKRALAILRSLRGLEMPARK